MSEQKNELELENCREDIVLSEACQRGDASEDYRDGNSVDYRDAGAESPKGSGEEYPKEPEEEYPKDPGGEYPKDPGEESPKGSREEYPKDPEEQYPKDSDADYPKDEEAMLRNPEQAGNKKRGKHKKPRKQKRSSRRFSLPVLIVCIFAALGAGFAAGRQFAVINRVGSRVYNNKALIDKIERLEAYMEMFYLEDIDPDKVMDGALRGVVSGLGDPFSAYYNKEDVDDLMASDSGQYHGIGVSVYKDISSGYIVIDDVMSDQPADLAGIEAGDLLMKIDGTSVSDITLTEAVNKIKKTDSESVHLEIQRASEILEMDVKKDDIEVQTVKYEMMEDQIAYLSVSEFIENTDEQFIKAIDDLEQQGMKGLVLDLRDNGGGIVDTCVNMVSRIIPEGETIAYTLDRKGKRTDFTSNSAETVDVPIVILVNKGTASASELMTGCLRDYGLARVMGSTTYGKGIVQHVYSLGDGTAIKLTAEKYYTPNGNYIHKVGIEPDIKNEYTSEEWREVKKGNKEDRQLKEALSLLKE